MQGIGAYSSDEEVVPAVAPVEKQATPAEPKPAPAPVAPKSEKKPECLPAQKLKQYRQELGKQKSATAVVNLVRRWIGETWDFRWGAEALYQIAKRSTARTRKEWSLDKTVKKLADNLKSETGEKTLVTDNINEVLVALEALRRMAMQDPESQKQVLETIVLQLVADNWKHPAKSLARLFWLGAPLKLKGDPADFTSILPTELRNRANEFDGPDMALLLAALRKQGSRDAALLEKVTVRLQAEGAHEGVSVTELVEMAEALNELKFSEEATLRPLGQEILRRRGELSPDESHRVHTAFQGMKLPLPQVWTQPGASKKRDAGGSIVTTQAFAPQEGHEKKRRGNHDIERTSPPRVVRDYKMMSY